MKNVHRCYSSTGRGQSHGNDTVKQYALPISNRNTQVVLIVPYLSHINEAKNTERGKLIEKTGERSSLMTTAVIRSINRKVEHKNAYPGVRLPGQLCNQYRYHNFLRQYSPEKNAMKQYFKNEQVPALILPALLILGIVLGLATDQAAAATAPTYEESVELQASKLFGKEYTTTNLYKIDEQVYNDCLVNQYKVASQYGTFRVSSTSALKQLIVEIKAIAEMKKVATDDTAIDSVIQSGKNTVNGVINLIQAPKETFEGAASGLSSMFNRAKEVVGKRDTTEAEDNKMEQLIGKTKSKGEIANRFGVNVYSHNPVLQEELDRLAWADYLGGIGLGLAQSAVTGGMAGLFLTTSGTARLLNEAINSTPASELWLQNRNKLLKMGIDPDLIMLFLNHPKYSPALYTVMVTALEQMEGVANRELFLKVALSADRAETARTITEICAMTASYHKNIKPLQELRPMGRLLHTVTTQKDVVVLFPADHLLWSEEVADIVSWMQDEAKSSEYISHSLWIYGDFSALATQNMKKNGWQLQPKSFALLFPDSRNKNGSAKQ